MRFVIVSTRNYCDIWVYFEDLFESCFGGSFFFQLLCRSRAGNKGGLVVFEQLRGVSGGEGAEREPRGVAEVAALSFVVDGKGLSFFKMKFGGNPSFRGVLEMTLLLVNSSFSVWGSFFKVRSFLLLQVRPKFLSIEQEANRFTAWQS